jgi:hypothetical protein
MCPVTTERSQKTWWKWVFGGVAVLAVGLFVAGVLSGCRQHPTVSSREGLSLLRLLNTACNTRDEAKLNDAERTMNELERRGKLTTAEKASFARIISAARSGDWATAEADAFRMASDQVGVGHPAPDESQAPVTKPKRKPQAN